MCMIPTESKRYVIPEIREGFGTVRIICDYWMVAVRLSATVCAKIPVD